eukprot:TRINITY_DN700_c0_g1_i2.p1 TRINITY_DN700_c0_g1~~TRINITY_DN700_c0_g1_i2.p1  ORF type:complete len:216 (+),score=38.64 TRINITY_DN700_c0_g1_i2:70-717(+)
MAEETVTVLAYGRMIDECMAKRTFPKLSNFRKATVKGWKRCFNLVAVSALQKGIPTLEIAMLSVIPASADSVLYCSAFDVPKARLDDLLERHHELKMIEVPFTDVDDKGEVVSSGTGVLSVATSDEWYKTERCVTDEEYHKRVGQYYDGALWRKDIFPSKNYMKTCLISAQLLGEAFLTNFLDHTFLGDEVTTLRTYIKSRLDLRQEVHDLLLSC